MSNHNMLNPTEQAALFAMGEVFCNHNELAPSQLLASFSEISQMTPNADDAIDNCGVSQELEDASIQEISERLIEIQTRYLERLKHIDTIAKTYAMNLMFTNDSLDMADFYDALMEADEGTGEEIQLIESGRPVEIYDNHTADALIAEARCLTDQFKKALLELPYYY